HHTGHVSTMAQGFGYLFAGLGPFGLGWLHTATGSWTAPLLALIILLVFQLVIGAFASQDRHVRARSAHTREVVLRGCLTGSAGVRPCFLRGLGPSSAVVGLHWRHVRATRRAHSPAAPAPATVRR